MPFMLVGDTAATYPKLLAVTMQPDADDRLVNEVMGFVTRVGALSAQHLTDSIVDWPTCALVGGMRTTVLIEICLKVGLFEPIGDDPMGPIHIIEDREFLGIRSKQEKDNKADAAMDKSWTVKAAVLFRDGDNCRWCGNDVYWSGRITPRKATIDHLDPDDKGAQDPDRLVVACLRCNSSRKDDADGSWDTPLRPPPDRPRYTAHTRNNLTKRDYVLPPLGKDGPRSAPKGDPGANGTSEGPLSGPGVSVDASEGSSMVIDPDIRANVSAGPKSGSTYPAPGDAFMDRQGSDHGVTGREGLGRVGSGREGAGLDRQGRSGSGGDGSGGKAGSSHSQKSARNRRRRRR